VLQRSSPRSRSGLVDLRHQHAIEVERRELQHVRRACEAAAAVSEGAAQHRQARDRPELHRPVAMMLEADQRAKEGRLRGRILTREALDPGGVEPHGPGHFTGRIRPHPFHQGVIAGRMPTDVLAIDQPVPHHDVHDGEGEERIRAGTDLQVPVRLRGRARPDRIDHDQSRPALPRVLDQRPVVQVRDDRVRAPQDDVPAVEDVFGIDPGAGTDRCREAGGRHGAADVAIEPAAAHRAEQAPVERRHLDHALRPGRTVGKDGLGSGLGADGIQSLCDVGERLVPPDANEPPLPFGPRPLQGMEHTIGVIDPLEIVIHLGAQRSARERVGGITVKTDRGVAVHVDDPAAGVRAIVAARTANAAGGRDGQGQSHACMQWILDHWRLDSGHIPIGSSLVE
jgi:hypothetical protein